MRLTSEFKESEVLERTLRNTYSLKQCLIFVSLTYYNKWLSFDGSDGRKYINELCLDSETIASIELSKMGLTDEEKELMQLWNRILEKAKKTKNYNNSYKYDFYQIAKELNTSRKDENKKNCL